jgi:hypothetical protein
MIRTTNKKKLHSVIQAFSLLSNRATGINNTTTGRK